MSAAWAQGAVALVLTASLIAPGRFPAPRSNAAIDAVLHRAVQAAKTLVVVHVTRFLPWPGASTPATGG